MENGSTVAIIFQHAFLDRREEAMWKAFSENCSITPSMLQGECKGDIGEEREGVKIGWHHSTMGRTNINYHHHLSQQWTHCLLCLVIRFQDSRSSI
jgi:hypothetical protein